MMIGDSTLWIKLKFSGDVLLHAARVSSTSHFIELVTLCPGGSLRDKMVTEAAIFFKVIMSSILFSFILVVELLIRSLAQGRARTKHVALLA